MEILLFWLVGAIVVAIAAGARGRSGLGWFVLAVILSPLIALVLVLVMPNLKLAAAAAAGMPSPATHVKCPDCRELVLMEARVLQALRLPPGAAAGGLKFPAQ
jgi:hypothetical protein